jgi:hypothetical protein
MDGKTYVVGDLARIAAFVGQDSDPDIGLSGLES